MTRKKQFRIKSKSDAKYIAKEIKDGKKLYYYLPLFGINGGIISVEWKNKAGKFKISEMCSGWTDCGYMPELDIVEYIWTNRQKINVDRHSH